MKKLVAVICSISIIIAISLILGCGGGGGGGSANNGNDLFKVINTVNKNISADSATQIGVLTSDGIQLNLSKGALSDNSNVAVRQYSNDAAMARFTENFPSLASFTVVSSLYELTAKDNKSKTLTVLEIPSEVEVALTEDLNTNKLYYAVVKQNGEWTLLPLQNNSSSNSSRLASNASRSIKMIFNTIYESLFIVAVTKKNATNSKLTYAEDFIISLNGSETSPQTITASYTQKFDNDIEASLRITLKGDVSPDKAEIFITALQNENKKISIKKSDKTYKDFDFTTAEQRGKYQTTFKLTSDLATSKLSGNTATYNFIIKAKDMKVSDMPTKLVFKASVKGSSLFYSNDMQINFEKGADQPTANIKGSAPAETEAEINQSVVIAFSQKMNTEAVEKAISIKAGNKVIEASNIKWNSAKTELTLTLKNLDVNTKHTVSISSSALSETGIPLKAFLFSFTTKNLYRIKYDGNGSTSGTVPTDTNYYNHDDLAKIASSGNLKKEGYYFVAWNVKPDESGQGYSENEEISVTENLTLYAIWGKLYTIKYDGNGNTSGENPSDSNFHNYEEIVSLPSYGSLKKDGYFFISWNTKPDGNGTNCNPNDEFSLYNYEELNKDNLDYLTLYAIWGKTKVSGIISQNTTWTKANSPYVLTDKVQIAEDVTLTIESGVTVFGNSNQIQPFGTLNAIGNKDNRISFYKNPEKC